LFSTWTVAIAVDAGGAACFVLCGWVTGGDDNRFEGGGETGALVAVLGLTAVEAEIGGRVGVVAGVRLGALGECGPTTAAEDVPPVGCPLIQIRSTITMMTTPTAVSGARSRAVNWFGAR
jgi:hypothetical protein